MKPSLRISAFLQSLLASLLCSATWAQAQDATPADPPAVPTELAPAKPTESPPEPQPQPGAASWISSIKFEGFVDTYASANWAFPKPQSATAQGGGNRFRAFDSTNGMALHWIGLGASLAPDPVGGTIDLRFGPSAVTYAGLDSNVGLTYVKQAFVSWKPAGKASILSLDLGKFDSPFGSEPADSQRNPNYTRSMLFTLGQPLFLTGLRGELALSEAFSLKAFVVNGWNNSVDNNIGKSFAVQMNVKPSSDLTIAIGYMTGPEGNDTSVIDCGVDTVYQTGRGCVPTPNAVARSYVVHGARANKHFRHFGDIVVDYTPTKRLRLLANANYGRDRVLPNLDQNEVKTVQWVGANLVVRYGFSDLFAAALRGGAYRDVDGFTTATASPVTISDFTLTLALSPTPNLILKLDNRIDIASESIFQRDLNKTGRTQATSTLGVVFTTI